MVPLAETNASRAVCRTRHLTAFGAGLFVPANAVSFTVPVGTTKPAADAQKSEERSVPTLFLPAQERPGAPSLVVLLVCVLGLMSYVVAAAILHKLDQLDLRRAAVVPLCGCDGLFKYEIQVKTGWSRGAGRWLVRWSAKVVSGGSVLKTRCVDQTASLCSFRHHSSRRNQFVRTREPQRPPASGQPGILRPQRPGHLPHRHRQQPGQHLEDPDLARQQG